ncbi:MAG: Gx transporter family protein [Oscillospiraceae bacterium]|nr:Gx transporter family protein [Oscillospiraceae bacterium]
MSKHINTKRICFMGLLFAVAVVLSYIEGMIVIPGLPPGVKLGLSNIVTMYCVFFLGVPGAYTIAALKALSVLLMRGPTGALLSLLGGLLSVTVMLLLLRMKKAGLSYLVISIFGAIGHNMGQLLGAALLTGTTLTLYYFPILILSGIGMGFVTGLVLKTVLPAVEKLDRQLR